MYEKGSRREPVSFPKVVATRCRLEEDIPTAIDSLFDNLDNDILLKLFKPGFKVLIKPNIVNNMPPSSGVITKPEIVEAVIKKVQSFGALPIIAEGQVHGIKSDGFSASGLKKIAEKNGISLVDLNQDAPVEVKIEKGKILKKVKVAKTVLECDKIISLPVMKTNIAVLVTLSLKNMIGILVAFEKHKVHLNGLSGINQCIVDLNTRFRPDLTITDGIIGMEGDGPTNGKPIRPGVLLASFDPVAADSAACHIMGINPKSVKYLRLAEEEKLGSTHYELIGPSLSEIKIDYELPTTYRSKLRLLGINRFEPFFMWLINKHSYIRIDETKCNGCGVCKEICPSRVITVVQGKAVVNRKECLKCICCQEVCSVGAPTLTGWINLRNKFFGAWVFGKDKESINQTK